MPSSLGQGTEKGRQVALSEQRDSQDVAGPVLALKPRYKGPAEAHTLALGETGCAQESVKSAAFVFSTP